MSGNSAAPANFGWDFQVNAGIVLLIENYAQLDNIRMDGAKEDIEIKLINGSYVFAQAKSTVKPDDYRNVKPNITKALSTLHKAATEKNYEELIYITNTPNPLSNKHEMGQFYAHARVRYKDLTNKNKKFIDDILENISKEFDKEHLRIEVVPFFSDELKERYKEVKQLISEKLGEIDYILPSYAEKIMEQWQQELFKNQTKVDTSITVSKRELQWPIVVTLLDRTGIRDNIDALDLDFDEAEYDEIQRKFHGVINNHAENFEFLTKIVTDHAKYCRSKKSSNCKVEFIQSNWEQYKENFLIDGFTEHLQEALTKIVMNKIIDSRYMIHRIMESGV